MSKRDEYFYSPQVLCINTINTWDLAFPSFFSTRKAGFSPHGAVERRRKPIPVCSLHYSACLSALLFFACSKNAHTFGAPQILHFFLRRKPTFFSFFFKFSLYFFVELISYAFILFCLNPFFSSSPHHFSLLKFSVLFMVFYFAWIIHRCSWFKLSE